MNKVKLASRTSPLFEALNEPFDMFFFSGLHFDTISETIAKICISDFKNC